ncbi:MAG: helix-turn-helix domain-containing protein [Lachnospiraceae bacterium]|nr:helix-turn-helix domain-containing protein [Lachnospiraceae bacterium]
MCLWGSDFMNTDSSLNYRLFSLLEIALSLGYSSQSAFSASFKKFVSVTPKKYRDDNYNSNMKQ